MLHLRRLENITEADLISLKESEVREGQLIDYKRAINLGTKEAKIELLKDISSFANASGGDLAYGMEETNGLPTALCGLLIPDFEALEKQILQLVRSHLKPSVAGLRIRVLSLISGTAALIVRIPKTWNGPHMVIMGGENRCWTRDHSGKRAMDIDDLKQVIAYSQGAAHQMKQFRMERIGNLIAGESPIPISSKQCAILHMLPLVSFTGNYQIDIFSIPDGAIPLLGANHSRITSTIEGKVSYHAEKTCPPDSYSLVFRNGVIEAVWADLRSKAPTDADVPYFHAWHKNCVLQAVGKFLQLYQSIDMPCPIFGVLSLTGVKGFKVYPEDWAVNVAPTFPLNRDDLFFPEFIIETLEDDATKLLKETFDIWWQACGWDKR